MKKSIQMEYNQLMAIVERRAVNHNGAGFTVELAPTITKQIKYVSRYASLFSNKIVWAPIETNKRGGFATSGLDKFAYSHYHAPTEIEMMLPNGIQIIRTPIKTLKDERDNGLPLSATGKYAYYTEGRQVYLSVSDECAAKIFEEKYTDVGYPFRENLLSKHSDLLRKIVQFLFDDNCFSNFYVGAEFVGRSQPPHINFKEINMMPLNSTGQLYGMTLALIETIKNTHHELFDSHIYTVDVYGDNTPLEEKLYICLEKLPKIKQNEELKEW